MIRSDSLKKSDIDFVVKGLPKERYFYILAEIRDITGFAIDIIPYEDANELIRNTVEKKETVIRMTDKFHQKIHRVISEIEEELGNIERLLSELNEHQKEEPRNSFYLRAVGSIFHDFYCGVERIFERIAEELNGGIPEGENWHIQLLKDMSLQIEEVRPSVISKELVAELKGYLEFRHRVQEYIWIRA